MEELHVYAEYNGPVDSSPSTNRTGTRSPKLKCRSHGAVVLSLGLLSVFLLARLISFFVYDHNSVGGSAADLSTIKANLTERLRASEDKLSSVSEERDLLNASFTNLIEEKDRLQRLSINLTEEKDRLQRLSTNLTKEKDRLQRLSTNLTKEKDRLHRLSTNLTKEKDGLQRLSTNLTEEKDRLQRLSTNLIEEMDRRQRWCKQKKTCPEGWRMFHCSCYLLSTRSDSWEKSRKDCRDKGADLVIIDSLEEQKFLSSIIDRHRIWIGLSDRDDEGTWKWIDGTPLTEAYWDLDEPNNGGGDHGEEDCVEILGGRNADGNWNDVLCNNSLQWICENLA
ncbi:CD209 antigen-like [Cebidichthys violaceus]|uniref:CD209 antigen-like n=1 Tax=Cebidichthys violaceus TaxID=271503 RepID=UPI0035CC2A38